MLTSAEQTFSDSQAVTSSAASTNILDLGATGTVLGAPAALIRDIGKGKPIPIMIRHLVAAGGTSPTFQVQVQVDDNAGFASATTVATSETVAGATAGQEQWVNVYLPEGVNERYLRLNYVTGGTSPTHTVSAGVVMSRNSNYTVPGV